MTDPAHTLDDRLYAALRLTGIVPTPTVTSEIIAVVREVVAEEIASLGGHLLGHYGEGTILATGAAPDASDAALATLGGYLTEHYGWEG